MHPREFYSHSAAIRRILDVFLTDEFSPGEPGRFAWVYHFLVENSDRFHHLADLESYLEAHSRVERDYADRDDWARKGILNVARSARFSTLATVLEYARDVLGAFTRTPAWAIGDECRPKALVGPVGFEPTTNGL